MTTDPPPPPAATDEAQFVAQLRRLKNWSGLSFRELERRATAAGDTLPYSTAATMLGKNRLPRAEVVVAFARACGVDEPGVRQWRTTRTAIADSRLPAPGGGRAGAAAAVRPVSASGTDVADAGDAVAPDLVTRVVAAVGGGWRAAVAGVAALVLVFGGWAALPGDEVEEEIVVVVGR